MQQYLRRNRLSELLDTLGIYCLILLAATLWFIWLWGLCIPSLLAGGALGMLGILARSRRRQQTVLRREKALRASIGAELMLEEMLLADAKEAHLRAALMLSEQWQLTMVAAQEEGALCRQGDEMLLVVCVRTPPGGDLSQGDLLSVQRAVRRSKAQRGVICAMGQVPAKIAAAAEQTPIPLRIIRRETLLRIAGQLAPASDEQLVALGQRRRHTAGKGAVLSLVFRPNKARRYFLYGLVMLLLYVLTAIRLYAVPGMICLTMGVMCRTRRAAPEML